MAIITIETPNTFLYNLSMKKAFKYCIYPTKKQRTLLVQTLGICCELYNSALQERRDAYRIAGKSISYHDQAIQLPEIKKTRTDLKDIHSQVLQDVLKRLDRAMDAFLRRVKAGETPGYPRFRSRSRYDSFTFTQSGFEIKDGKLFLSKIGHIKIKLHRQIEGKIKTCSIRRTATGKWFACFCCEVEVIPLAPNTEAVGADAGLTALLTLSNGEKIDAPKFFREEEKELAKVQRQLSKAAKGSKQRKKARKKVARVHERIANKRSNYAHKLSHVLVLCYGMIFFEDLKIRNMVRNHHLAKSIQDAAWNQMVRYTSYKAANAGRYVDTVDPSKTTQNCSGCGRLVKKTLSERVHRCPYEDCGLVLDRDHNAALNILRLGLQSVGTKSVEAPASSVFC